VRGPYEFGRASTKQLLTVHHDLQIVLQDAIQYMDFSITQGARTVEEQIRNIRKQVSDTLDSRHIPRDDAGLYDPNAPCVAVDLVPYTKGVNPWPQDSDSRVVRQKKAHRFYYMQGIIYTCAQKQGIRIRQGLDWDMDGDFFDQKFDDLPHVELVVSDWQKLVVEGTLLAEANEAGIGPLRLLTRYVGKRGLGLVDTFFASVESGSIKLKK